MGCIDAYNIPNNKENEHFEQNGKGIEHFEQGDVRDTCHYMCSSFSYVNVIIIILILLLAYHIFTKSDNKIIDNLI